MREVVEEHRGIQIYKSPEVPGNTASAWRKPGECHEATIQGWRVVGPIIGVRNQIDKMLDAQDDPPSRHR